jgi:hypothetical protein
MQELCITIPTSLGEIINIKYHLDLVKFKYDKIKINFNTNAWRVCLHTDTPGWEQRRVLWEKYLIDLGQLFFSNHPYVIERNDRFPNFDTGRLVEHLKLKPQKAEMAHLLCKGKSLNLSEPYIVLTTKLRNIPKSLFYPKSNRFWNVIQKLATHYRIVLLGERDVEIRREYGNGSAVFGLYEDAITNLPADRILDLTLPALGETVSNLAQIQQDCLIMKEAKFVITLGVGGNFCMATSVADMTVGFRADELTFTDAIYDRAYPNAMITKDWNKFITTLTNYLQCPYL